MTKEELEIREILKSEMFATNGHAKANNPHFEIIFDMAYKLGFDQQNKALLKEVEELKEREDELLESRYKFASQSTDRLIEITNLKQQLQEKEREVKELQAQLMEFVDFKCECGFNKKKLGFCPSCDTQVNSY